MQREDVCVCVCVCARARGVFMEAIGWSQRQRWEHRETEKCLELEKSKVDIWAVDDRRRRDLGQGKY